MEVEKTKKRFHDNVWNLQGFCINYRHRLCMDEAEINDGIRGKHEK